MKEDFVLIIESCQYEFFASAEVIGAPDEVAARLLEMGADENFDILSFADLDEALCATESLGYKISRTEPGEDNSTRYLLVRDKNEE